MAEEEEWQANIRWLNLGSMIRQFRSMIRESPVVRPVELGQIRSELKHYDFQRPIPLGELTTDIVRLLRLYSVQVTHPRYFGLFNPGVREAGIIAETLAAAFNPQLAVWSHSPIANEIEACILRKFTSLLGLPQTSAANFTTGGAEANLSALIVALGREFPTWSDQGIASLNVKPRIYLSSDAHDSFVKAARICGLGSAAVRRIPTCSTTFAVDPIQLRKIIENDYALGAYPLMIVGTAGTTNTGAIDPLESLAAVAREHGAWFHVDAAWGGTAVLSPKLRPLLAGIELADSVTWDAHKWLSVPFSAGMFFCRHPQSIHRAFSVSALYMPVQSAGTTDPYASTIQWTRRAIGLKVFMSIAELGVDGYSHLIEHQAAMGDLLRRRLTENGFAVVNQTALPLVCFSHPLIRDKKVSTGEILRKIYSRGQVWISDVEPTGSERLLRACITHYEANETDIECLLQELNNSLADI